MLPRPDHIQGGNHPGHLSHPPRPPPVGPRGRRRGRRGPGAGLLNPVRILRTFLSMSNKNNNQETFGVVQKRIFFLGQFIRNLAGKASEFIGCNENPCKNNGTCLAIGRQNCICANGWGGKFCELRKNCTYEKKTISYKKEEHFKNMSKTEKGHVPVS